MSWNINQGPRALQSFNDSWRRRRKKNKGHGDKNMAMDGQQNTYIVVLQLNVNHLALSQ